jgi:hypothetical protein
VRRNYRLCSALQRMQRFWAVSRQPFPNRKVRVSNPGESHPEALSELYVSLSTHTAPIMEPRRAPICQ